LPSRAVAEHALLLVLAALRNLPGWTEVIRRPEESSSHIERLQTRTLCGRAVGIHGFGRVVRALVPLLRPFGVMLSAFSQGVPPALMNAFDVTPCASLDALAKQSEVFIECEALTPATAGVVSAEVLATLPDGAVFVNVARGGLVDEQALLREASTGRIRVALDVVTTEPLGPHSAFLQVGNSVLSPHIAGPTFDQYPLCANLAFKNVASFLRGAPLQGRLSLEEYDRAT
jgi:phosphoglycerate dehydrogenase-like enzyme